MILMRTFIYYDGRGQILSVLKSTALPAGLEQPFHIGEEGGGVIELGEDDPAAALDNLELHEGYVVDVAEKRLVKKPAEPDGSGKPQ